MQHRSRLADIRAFDVWKCIRNQSRDFLSSVFAVHPDFGLIDDEAADADDFQQTDSRCPLPFRGFRCNLGREWWLLSGEGDVIGKPREGARMLSSEYSQVVVHGSTDHV